MHISQADKVTKSYKNAFRVPSVTNKTKNGSFHLVVWITTLKEKVSQLSGSVLEVDVKSNNGPTYNVYLLNKTKKCSSV